MVPNRQLITIFPKCLLESNQSTAKKQSVCFGTFLKVSSNFNNILLKYKDYKQKPVTRILHKIKIRSKVN